MNMPKLDQLLCHYNLTSVPVVKIGSVIDYEQPSKYIVQSTRYDDAYPTPVLTAGQTFILGYTDDKSGIYAASKDNPVIIFDDFTGAFKWVDFPFKVKSSAMKLLTAKENAISLRYFFHLMGHINFTSDEHKRLWIATYSNFSIPLPPLEVQQEIVQILDQYTQLTAELAAQLTAELTARKQQYEYYQTRLFTYADNVQLLPLAQIAEIGTGSSNTNEELEDGKYPFFVRSQDVRRKNTYEYDETAIITSGDGVGVGKIFHYVEGKYALHQRAYRIHIIDDRVIPRFYYYYMKCTFLPYIEKASFHSSVTSIRRPMLNNFPVPLISLPEQRRIVAILDRFDALCNDLTSGLPAEIAARQKQYEYYRDKLLTFKKLEE